MMFGSLGKKRKNEDNRIKEDGERISTSSEKK